MNVKSNLPKPRARELFDRILLFDQMRKVADTPPLESDRAPRPTKITGVSPETVIAHMMARKE